MKIKFSLPVISLCSMLYALCVFVSYPVSALPSYQEVRRSYVKSDSLLLDRHGEILHELRMDRDRRRLDWTPLKNISPALKEAVIQAEDKRFYDHWGVDYKAMGVSFFQGLTSASLRGASTIPMQLAAMVGEDLRATKGRKSLWQKGKQALASSLNVPAVRALSLVGEEAFLNKLGALGIKALHESGDFYGPALALGSADVSLWELVNAYRTLANGGEWSELRLIPPTLPLPLDGGGQGGGDIASPFGFEVRKRVFSPESSYLVSDILGDREARAVTFGLENPLATRFWTAVKTGTSKDMRDNWCIGYSRKYTVGVWVGNFSGEPMWNVSGISGAAPVWVELMNWLHRNEVQPRRDPPAGLVKARVKIPDGRGSSPEEWFIRGTEPVSLERRTAPYNQGIVYPPSGTIFALDPDIPQELQKIFFIAQTPEKDWHWNLNGKPLALAGKATPWSPKAGLYRLALLDDGGRIIDSVQFEVRGSSAEVEDEDRPPND